MQHVFELNRNIRQTFVHFLDHYSSEQLNSVPQGFSNNLIWNMGHVIVTQQGLVYSLSGLTPLVPREMIDRYKKGTRPEAPVEAAEMAEIRRLLIELPTQIQVDYADGKFRHYQEFEIASVRTVLKNADQALMFNNFHEGMHLGMMMQIRKFI